MQKIDIHFDSDTPKKSWPENAKTVYSNKLVPKPTCKLTSNGEAVITTAARYNQYYAKLLQDDSGNTYAISYSGRLLYFDPQSQTFEEVKKDNQLLSFTHWDKIFLTESKAHPTTQIAFRNYIEIQSGTAFINELGYKVDPNIWFNTQMPIMYHGGYNPDEFITDEKSIAGIDFSNQQTHYYILTGNGEVLDASHIVNFCERYAEINRQILEAQKTGNKIIKGWASTSGNFVYYQILSRLDIPNLDKAIGGHLAAITEYAQAIPQNVIGRLFRRSRESRFGMAGGLSPEDMSANALAVEFMSEIYSQNPSLVAIPFNDSRFQEHISKLVLKQIITDRRLASKEGLHSYSKRMNGPVALGIYRNTPVSFGLKRDKFQNREPRSSRRNLPKQGVDWEITRIDAINDLVQRLNK